MNKLLFLSLISFVLSNSYTNPSVNVEQFSTIDYSWDSQTKMTFYQTEKISPELALIYQMVSPPFWNIGYAYSDNWKRGAQLDAVSIGSIVVGAIMVATTFEEDYRCEYDDYGYEYCDYYESDPSPLGGLLYLFGFGVQVYKFIDAYKLAETYNDNLYKTLFYLDRPSFSIGYSKQTKGIELALSVPIR